MLLQRQGQGSNVQDVVVFQIAGLLGLVGMGLTWTGVLARYMGFYDLSLVWNHVLWGMALGALVAVLEFDSLFLPYYAAVIDGSDATRGPSLLWLAWWVSMHSAVVHLFLRRERVRRAGAHVTSGWAFGATMGGMHGVFLSAQYLNGAPVDGWVTRTAGTVAFALLLPRLEAVITAWQGHLMLHGRRLGAVIRAALWRMVMLTLVYYAFFEPLAWLAALAALGLIEPKVNGWVWSGLDKRAQRMYRRVRANAARERRTAEREQE